MCVLLLAQGFAHRAVPTKHTHIADVLRTYDPGMQKKNKKHKNIYSRPACGKLTKSKWQIRNMAEKKVLVREGKWGGGCGGLRG